MCWLISASMSSSSVSDSHIASSPTNTRLFKRIRRTTSRWMGLRILRIWRTVIQSRASHAYTLRSCLVIIELDLVAVAVAIVCAQRQRIAAGHVRPPHHRVMQHLDVILNRGAFNDDFVMGVHAHSQARLACPVEPEPHEVGAECLC